jgi:poly(A) polymerase
MPKLKDPIDHDLIDPDALKVVRRLSRYHHEAYLVGGCVRDLLLGRQPKDFDLATSATPNEIKGLFRNSRIIGRRFKLAHIFFGPKIIETATFRQNPRNDEDEEGNGDAAAEERLHNGDSLLIRRDNVFGTAEDDALRRDFTLNGLFYDPVGHEVIDFVQGRADLEQGLIRTIGDPDIRLQEDPVRILRAIKFAARLELAIEPETREAITRYREHITACAKARVLEEIYRLLREGAACRAMALLEETGVARVLLPELGSVLQDPARHEVFLARLRALDALHDEIPLTNATLLATLSHALLVDTDGLLQGGGNGSARLDDALRAVLKTWTPSRRDRDRLRQILMAQRRLCPSEAKGKRRRRRPKALVAQDYFPESLALYKVCCHTGEADPSTIETWEGLYASVIGGRPTSVQPPERRSGRRGGRRRKSRRRGGRSSGNDRRGADRKGSDRRGADRKGSDRRGGDRKGGDRKGGARKGTDRKSADRKSADRKSADRNGGGASGPRQ